MKTSFLLIFTLLAMACLAIAQTPSADDKRAQSLIKLAPYVQRDEVEFRSDAYLKLPLETRRAFEGSLIRELGLSALAHIRLVGWYQPMRLREEGKKLFQVNCTEIPGGHYLHYSVLFDPEDRTVRVVLDSDGKSGRVFSIDKKSSSELGARE